MDVTAHERAWTRWSKCLKSGIEFRHRYLKCKEAKDVRKCPKESVPCNRSTANRLFLLMQSYFSANAENPTDMAARIWQQCHLIITIESEAWQSQRLLGCQGCTWCEKMPLWDEVRKLCFFTPHFTGGTVQNGNSARNPLTAKIQTFC